MLSRECVPGPRKPLRTQRGMPPSGQANEEAEKGVIERASCNSTHSPFQNVSNCLAYCPKKEQANRQLLYEDASLSQTAASILYDVPSQ